MQILKLIGLAFVGLIILLIVVDSSDTAMNIVDNRAEQKSPDAWKHENNWSMAYIMMEDFVKQRLKAPRDAEFAGVLNRQDHVTVLGGQKYRVVSYVDAQNSFGAKIRTRFIGEIQQISEDQWQLVSLNLLE